MTVKMNFVPNAADGFTQAVSEKIKTNLGLAKNIVDILSIIITIVIGILFAGKLVGIGIGTVAAVFGVGRSIALVNMLLKKKIFLLGA